MTTKKSGDFSTEPNNQSNQERFTSAPDRITAFVDTALDRVQDHTTEFIAALFDLLQLQLH